MTVCVGLDLGGTNIKCAVVEIDGGEPRVLATASEPTRSEEGPDAVLARVARLAQATVAPFGPPQGVGLGVPGHFDAETGAGVILPNLAGDWVGRPIAGPVAERLGLPVLLINDARALTLAELRMGAGRGARTMVCVTLGTGVGGGVVVDRRLHLGLGHAGEIGHTIVEPDGPPCGCGNRGCLDRVAGAAAIAARAGRATVREVIAAARGGDARARAALEHAARAVGVALGGAAVLLWPDRIVVGGGVAEAGELLLAPLRREIVARARVCPTDALTIAAAELGPSAGAVGAALWRHEAPDADGSSMRASVRR
ncbi:MAG TPA: ROK family protein [Baekduia sp.]|uniref:ROK family protein n=1 Tax=Baekduia sp. TaxID=2600305 RepID=UPI002C1DB617|nr:ROK family protein [Baekduia sp.]HMJ37727.1 ROK family protein [Baekduia sp.]